MTTRLLAIWTAFLLGTCLAQNLDNPVFAENERIPLAILLEAFKRDANSEIFHNDYEGADVYEVKRRWMVTGEEKTAFLNTLGEWLDAESIELVNFGGFWDMVKEWFTIFCSDDEAFGSLTFSLLPLEENNEEDVGRQYVRVEYIRPNEEHTADCFAWQGKVSKSVETLPQLPAGQEVCLDIYRSGGIEFARCPAWCENIVRFDLKNRSDKPVRLLRATAISDFMKVKFTPCTLPPGEQTTLEISVKPGAFSGKFIREVLLETDAPGQEFIRLPVSGIALPAVQVIPEKLPYDSTGKYIPKVIPPQDRITGIPMPVRPGDQKVWLGALRVGETRIQSFQLIPYDKSFQLSVLEQEQQGDAVISLSPATDGYRLDVTVCPAKNEERVEVRCTIAIDASVMRNLYDDPLDDKKPFVFAVPSPMEITVGYSMEMGK
ncbi:MAG: DUF1573 domain-containing protein [Victivallales bacterium]|nr:DUF1573 domain-containing protein [Victivallales bacterium]